MRYRAFLDAVTELSFAEWWREQDLSDSFSEPPLARVGSWAVCSRHGMRHGEQHKREYTCEGCTESRAAASRNIATALGYVACAARERELAIAYVQLCSDEAYRHAQSNQGLVLANVAASLGHGRHLEGRPNRNGDS